MRIIASLPTIITAGAMIINVNLSVLAQGDNKPLPENCFDLWVERNSYYNDVGYCFKTAKAQDYFKKDKTGQPCLIQRESEVEKKFTPPLLDRIAAINRRERAYGCK